MSSQVTINGKIVGTLDKEHKTFAKSVKLSRHLFLKLDAWGIDAHFFLKELLPNDFLIRIYEKEEGKFYEITATDFFSHKEYFHFKGKKDFGVQVFCSRKYWKIS